MLKHMIFSMFLGLAVLTLSGCASSGGSGWDVGVGVGGGSSSGGGGSYTHVGGGVGTSSGPPTHAPAHGFRKKHQHDEVELEYDSSLRVYVALGYPDIYYYGDLYYRGKEGHYQVSTSINGPWNETEYKKVPRGLRKKDKANKKRKEGKNKY